MLTAAQATWIATLSDTETVAMLPLDTTAEEKFQKVRAIIQTFLHDDTIPVEHHGSTRLGIGGQDEIDIYIPVAPEKFDSMIDSLIPLYGEPRSRYPQERARFRADVDGKHIDVFVINNQCDGWKVLQIFEPYLLFHPEVLEEYRQLKERLAGKSVQEYYREKTAFVNEIVERGKSRN